MEGFETLKSTTADTVLSLQSDVDQISKKLVSELSTAGQDMHAEIEKISTDLTIHVSKASSKINYLLES